MFVRFWGEDRGGGGALGFELRWVPIGDAVIPEEGEPSAKQGYHSSLATLAAHTGTGRNDYNQQRGDQI